MKRITVTMIATATILAGGVLSVLAENVPPPKRFIVAVPTRVIVAERKPALNAAEKPAPKKLAARYRHHHRYVHAPKAERNCFLFFCFPRQHYGHHSSRWHDDD